MSSRPLGASHAEAGSPVASLAARTQAAETAKLRVCDHCRIKKTKCDMGRPACRTCQLRHLDCTYSKLRRKPGPPKRFLAASRPMPEANLSWLSDARTSLLANQESSLPPFLNRLMDNERAVSDLSRFFGYPMESTLANGDFEMPSLNFTSLGFSPGRMLSDATFDSPELSPEVEEYLLDLYIQHIQPVYPLLRKSPPGQPKYGILEIPPRLKMAIYAVSSRFAKPGFVNGTLSPGDFAKRAAALYRGERLSMDEIKASILLCVHDMSASVTWDAVAEIARLSRMADLYHTLCVDKESDDSSDDARAGSDGDSDSSPEAFSDGAALNYDAEEWRSVWWCIYSLDTCCSAVAAISHAFATNVEGRMTLPMIPSSETTKMPKERELRAVDRQCVPLSGMKHWESMSMIFSNQSCRSRNLYLGACFLMRSVTNLRHLSRRGQGLAWRTRLQELESDCAATTFSLPPWVFNPIRNFATEETEVEHRHRLDMLLVWQCACLLLAISAAEVNTRSPSKGQPELQGLWDRTLSKANELVQVVQNWNPDYFNAVDPMCSYIIFLAGSILTMDHASGPYPESPSSRTSEHLDLLVLFLGQVGQYWPIGHHFANSLKAARTTSPGRTYEERFQYIFQLTLNGRLLDSPIEKAISLDSRPLAKPNTATKSPGSLREVTQEGIDSGAFSAPWLEDTASSNAGMDVATLLLQQDEGVDSSIFDYPWFNDAAPNTEVDVATLLSI
ncbi:hypothetical protein EDB80DRAFT_720579 [Ilyonectria destructans]|nr:hypothetical protein EDB80DRAFT_720579 [Ilyonectria destructans]